jgi:hypothetical protein
MTQIITIAEFAGVAIASVSVALAAAWLVLLGLFRGFSSHL